MDSYRSLGSATLLVLTGLGSGLMAEDQPAAAPASTTDQLHQLQERINALEREVKALQAQPAQTPSPAAPAATAAPPATTTSSLEARVWKLEADSLTDDGFSIGGVGDVTLTMQKGMGYTASGDFNPIFLYSYKDTVLFVAELNADQNGVALGQAWVAYTALPHLVLEAGYFPIPFGIYSERLSPTWINKFSTLAPAPYNEDYGVFSGDQTVDGAQVRGEVAIPTMAKLTYHIFVAAPPTYNGPDNADPDNRLTFGNLETTHVPPTIGARVGLLPSSNAEIGLSAMSGHIINNQTVDPTIDDGARRSFAAMALDGEYRLERVALRGECVRLNYQDPSGARQHSQGLYLQASRRLDDLQGWAGGLEPTMRVGRMQRSLSDNGFQDVSEIGVGVNYYATSFIRTSLMAMAASVHGEDLLAVNTTFTF
jgi:hypothetical protein